MKKIFAIFIVALLAISLVGCGDSKKSKEEKKQTADIVGYDDGKIVIKADKMETDEVGGFTINFTAENKTDNDYYTLSIMDAFLNDYYHVCVKECVVEIKSGKTKKDKIYISTEEIAKCGIKDISKVDLLISSTHMKTEYIKCSFLTHEEETSIEKPAEPKGQCYLDNDYCTVYVERVETEEGVKLIFDTRPKTENAITVYQNISLKPFNTNNGKEAADFDAEGNMIEYGLKTDVPGLDIEQSQTLIPGSVGLMTYNCIGQIYITHFNPMSTEVVASKDMDLSTLYVEMIIRNAEISNAEAHSEYFTITK